MGPPLALTPCCRAASVLPPWNSRRRDQSWARSVALTRGRRHFHKNCTHRKWAIFSRSSKAMRNPASDSIYISSLAQGDRVGYWHGGYVSRIDRYIYRWPYRLNSGSGAQATEFSHTPTDLRLSSSSMVKDFKQTSCVQKREMWRHATLSDCAPRT